jgi:hypothetical protein
MLRFSLVAVLALMLLESLPAVADSFWSHNGSEMRLHVDGSSRTFLYERPRPGIAAEGVERGTALFQGSLTEKGTDSVESSVEYSGTAFIFSARCGPQPYKVSGTLGRDGRSITLEGKAPRIDQSTCKSKGSKADQLNFEFVRSDKPPPSLGNTADETPCNITDPDNYRLCLEREGNGICRGRAVEELFECFRSAVDQIRKRSGMTGMADIEAGLAVVCSGGICGLAGGGPSYWCKRLDANRVRECDGDVENERCNEVSCPVRQCRMVCMQAD